EFEIEYGWMFVAGADLADGGGVQRHCVSQGGPVLSHDVIAAVWQMGVCLLWRNRFEMLVVLKQVTAFDTEHARHMRLPMGAQRLCNKLGLALPMQGRQVTQ